MQRAFRCFCHFVQANWETFAYLILRLLSQVFLLYLLLFPYRSALWVEEIEFCSHRRLSQEINASSTMGKFSTIADGSFPLYKQTPR